MYVLVPMTPLIKAKDIYDIKLNWHIACIKTVSTAHPSSSVGQHHATETQGAQEGTRKKGMHALRLFQQWQKQLSPKQPKWCCFW